MSYIRISDTCYIDDSQINAIYLKNDNKIMIETFNGSQHYGELDRLREATSKIFFEDKKEDL